MLEKMLCTATASEYWARFPERRLFGSGFHTLADVTNETPTPRVVGMMQKIVSPVANATGVKGRFTVTHANVGVIPAMTEHLELGNRR